MSDDIVSKFFELMNARKILDIGYAVPFDLRVLVPVSDEDKHLTDYRELKKRVCDVIEELFKDSEQVRRFKMGMIDKVEELLPDGPE